MQALDAKKALRIKKALWKGKRPSVVAREFGVAYATVTHIRNGLRWAGLKWPDGSVGGMSETRKKMVREAWKRAKL